MATNDSNRSFKDFVLKKERYSGGKWGEPVGDDPCEDWPRAEDHWEWPEIPAGPDEPSQGAEYVARDDDPKDGLGSLSSPGMATPPSMWAKVPPRGKMAGRARRASQLREHARGLSDAEYIEFMCEQLEQAKQARPITLVSDLHGNQYTPSPEEAFRYVASLAQNPLMLSRLLGSLKDTGVLADLVRELADDRDAMNGFVSVLGDPDTGPMVAGRLAKAMYDQVSARQSAPADVDLGAVAEAVSGPVWQDAPGGLEGFGHEGESGQDGTGEQTEDTDGDDPDLPPTDPPAAPEGPVPGEDEHDLSIGPDDAGDPGEAPGGGDQPGGGDGGDPAIDDADVQGDDDPDIDDEDMDAQVGSFAAPGGGVQPSSAAKHLVQAMMRYKPLADMAKGV